MAAGGELEVFAEGLVFLGAMSVTDVSPGNAAGLCKEGALDQVQTGMPVRTRLATTYLGSAWLPAVAIVSGLTDADAIAFSLSSLQRAAQFF